MYKGVFTLHRSFLCWCLMVLWDAASLLHVIGKRDPWRPGFPFRALVEPCAGIFWCSSQVEKEMEMLPSLGWTLGLWAWTSNPIVEVSGQGSISCQNVKAPMDLPTPSTETLCCSHTGEYPQLSLHHDSGRQALESPPPPCSSASTLEVPKARGGQQKEVSLSPCLRDPFWECSSDADDLLVSVPVLPSMHWVVCVGRFPVVGETCIRVSWRLDFSNCKL